MLADCVKSILSESAQPAEIVVVDQSEQPHPWLSTQPRSAKCWIRYVHMKEKGLSRGRNAGIELAQGRILAFTDDDMLATPGWLTALTRELRDERTVVTGKVVASADRGFAPSLNLADERREYAGRVGMDVLYSGNMAAERSVFSKIGIFDIHLGAGSEFPGAEDNDLGFRLLEAGFRIVYVPQAVLIHRAWRSRKDALILRWQYGHGQGGYYAKHFASGGYMARQMKHFIGDRLERAWASRYGVISPASELLELAGMLTGFSQWQLFSRFRRCPLRGTIVSARGRIDSAR